MIWLFLILLAAHVAYSVIANRAQAREAGTEHAVPDTSESEEPEDVTPWTVVWEHFHSLSELWDYLAQSPIILGRHIHVAIVEETIYRVTFQTILIGLLSPMFIRMMGPHGEWLGAALAIAVVAFIFHLAHEHFFNNRAAGWVEFYGFSVLLGTLYYLTGSFPLVVTIHAVRNLETCFRDYAVRLEETGDKEKAARDIELQPKQRTATRRGRRFSMVLSSALFIAAACFAYRQGVISRALFSPLYLGIGILAGHFIYAFSFWVTLLGADAFKARPAASGDGGE